MLFVCGLRISIFGDDVKAFYFFENTSYNNLVMSTQEWAGLILTFLSIAGIILGGLRWYIKVQTDPIVEMVADIRSETKTNGGTSMRDEIKAIKCEQEEAKEKRKETNAKIDHMYEVLLDYISRSK